MNDKREFLRVLLVDLWNSGFVSQDAETPIVGFDHIVPWHDCPNGIQRQNFTPPGEGFYIEVCKFPVNTADGEQPCCLVGYMVEIITVVEGGGTLEAERVIWKEKRVETIREVLRPGSRVTIPESIPHRLIAGISGMKAIRVHLRTDLFI